MPPGRPILFTSSKSFHHPLTRFSLPNEVTGSGLLAKRGWRWWISRRILWLLFLLFGRAKCDRVVLERTRGIPIVVFPGVFHPKLFLSTTLLLHALNQFQFRTNSSVLDLGTGTGVCAIFIAMKGAQVTATDISPIAVQCTQANIILNNMQDRVRVLEGDLFQPIEKQRFDLVIFNPPYYEGKPTDWAEYAWRGENVLCRFVEGLSAHLTPTGRALLSLSTETDLSAIKTKLQESGFETREARKRRIPGETIYVYECARAVR